DISLRSLDDGPVTHLRSALKRAQKRRLDHNLHLRKINAVIWRNRHRRMKLPQKWKADATSIHETMVNLNTRAVGLQPDSLFDFNRADRRYVAQPHADVICIRERFGDPLSRPKLSVVGVALAIDDRDFVIRKKFVPTATPNVVVNGFRWQS